MNKKFSIYQQILLIAICGFVIMLTIVACIHEIRLRRIEILFASDVGITQIMNEKIASAKFDSLIPNYIYNCEDISDIPPLLDTLGCAIFLPADKPTAPISWLELIYIETEKGTYTIGVIDGLFAIKMDGVYNYYECSARDTFLKKLYEIQKR